MTLIDAATRIHTVPKSELAEPCPISMARDQTTDHLPAEVRSADPLAPRRAKLMNDEEPHAPITCMLMYHSSMCIKSGGLCHSGQIGTIEAVHTPAVALEKLADHRLRGDSLVLRKKRPPTAEAMINPHIVADVLGIVGEVIADDVDDPAPLHQQRRRPPAETPVREELRRQLG
ncbi:hypothetical protein KRMM14A1004_06180 [Krasilnikovia sp. MM14-A1004]